MRPWVHLFSIVAGETKWRIVMSSRDNNIKDRARLTGSYSNNFPPTHSVMFTSPTSVSNILSKIGDLY